MGNIFSLGTHTVRTTVATGDYSCLLKSTQGQRSNCCRLTNPVMANIFVNRPPYRLRTTVYPLWALFTFVTFKWHLKGHPMSKVIADPEALVSCSYYCPWVTMGLSLKVSTLWMQNLFATTTTDTHYRIMALRTLWDGAIKRIYSDALSKPAIQFNAIWNFCAIHSRCPEVNSTDVTSLWHCFYDVLLLLFQRHCQVPIIFPTLLIRFCTKNATTGWSPFRQPALTAMTFNTQWLLNDKGYKIRFIAWACCSRNEYK